MIRVTRSMSGSVMGRLLVSRATHHHSTIVGKTKAGRPFPELGKERAPEGALSIVRMFSRTFGSEAHTAHATHAAHVGHGRRRVLLLRPLGDHGFGGDEEAADRGDRKSTRLNSSH